MASMWQGGASQSAIAVTVDASQPVISRVLRGVSPPTRLGKGRGKRAHNWNGGRHINHDGYVIVWVDPDSEFAAMRPRNGYVLEHRLVMARKLGRALVGNENVHHLNGIKDDNAPENLELWHTKQPKGTRGASAHCATCTCTED